MYTKYFLLFLNRLEQGKQLCMSRLSTEWITWINEWITKPIDSNGRTFITPHVIVSFISLNNEKIVTIVHIINGNQKFNKLRFKGFVQLFTFWNKDVKNLPHFNTTDGTYLTFFVIILIFDEEIPSFSSQQKITVSHWTTLTLICNRFPIFQPGLFFNERSFPNSHEFGFHHLSWW